MSREIMRERMAQIGYDEYYFGEASFLVCQGSDLDEVCQRVTDEIAESMGIINPDPEYCEWDGTDYGLINELVNEMILAE